MWPTLQVWFGSFALLIISPGTGLGGYTHYFTWQKKPSEEALRKCVADMRRIVEARKEILAGPDGTGQPQIGPLEISFNGRGHENEGLDEAHEPFVFPGKEGFNFCKTAYKPYDAVVSACLIVARDHFPREVLKIESDGDWDGPEWAEGIKLYSKVLNRAAKNPLSDGRTSAEPKNWSSGRWVLGVLGVILLFGILTALLYHRPDFTIIVNGRDTRFKGRIPQVRHDQIAEFLRGESGAGTSFKVFGFWDRQGLLRLRFGGSLTAGEQQRIRNFLLTILG